MRTRLDSLLAALRQDLGIEVTDVRVLPGALHASLREGLLTVPSQHVNHWRRFSVFPTALVRDIAYACKRTQLTLHGNVPPSTIEADSMAYAERFLRASSEADDHE